MRPSPAPSPLLAADNGRSPRIFIIDLSHFSRSNADREADEIVQNIATRIETIDPETTGERFIRTLSDLNLSVHHAFRLWEALESLTEASSRIEVIRLVAAGAFSRNELTSPERIRAYLERADWQQLLAAWKEDQVTRQIRHVARRLTGRHHVATAASDAATQQASQPPPAHSPAPASLAQMLQTHLPAKTQIVADAVGVALGVMKMEAKPWTIEAIVVRIRNMMGAMARIADRLIEEAFRWLAKRGVVENVGGYRLRDTTEDAIGRQILGMVG